MGQVQRVVAFVTALVIAAIVGWGVNGALLDEGWSTNTASVAGTIGFFAALIISYQLIYVKILHELMP